MFDLFDPERIGSRGTLETPELDLLIKKQKKELDDAKDWYHSNPVFVNSGAWLSKLVYSLYKDDSMDAVTAYYDTIANHGNLCLVNGIADSLHDAIEIDDDFCFDHTYACATLASRNESKLLDKVKHWKELSPVTILYREGIEGAFQLPVSKINNVDGFMLIGVDLPLLALMLTAFVKEQQTKPVNEREDTPEFIAKYLLPSMLYSQFNCIMLNLLDEREVKDSKWVDSVPFSHIDYTLPIALSQAKFFVDAAEKGMLINDLAESIPSIDGTMLDTVFKFGLPVTTSSHWFIIASGLTLARALISNLLLSSDNDSMYGKLDKIKRQVRSYRTWSKLPDKDLGKYFSSLYDEFIERMENK